MNKIKIFLVAAALLLSGQSFAQTTKATIQGEISSSTANGLLGGTILNNIVLSYVDWTTCSGPGGIVYWNAGTPTCLNAGTNGYTLTMVSGIPQWTLPASQSANTVYAGPSSGSPASPSFRALVGSDLPNPSASTLGGVQSAAAVSHQWINSISTSGVPQLSQPAFTDISGTLGVSGGGTNCTVASGTCLDNITGFSTTGYINRTGGGTYAFSTVIPVSSGGTAIASGTSGGILGFTASGTIASSGLLAQYSVVVGGGAGATPSTVANGTAGQIFQAQTSANPAWNTLSGDATITSGGVITVSASAITNSKLANANAYTFKGNTTSSPAAPTDFTPGSLANKASPAAGDYIVIADNASSGALKYATVSSIASAGSVGSVNGLTGAVSVTAGAGITVTPSSPNIAVAVKDGYTSNTTCTITDQSGAGLSITTNYCTVSVTNNIITVIAQITYPTNSSGVNTSISLPVAVPNRSTFCGSFSWNGTSLATGGIPCAIKNTSTATFFTNAGVAQTNSIASGVAYSFNISYPAS